MDDTQTSRASDATRKRRSSILKSQRPPRTPFSELEFNVATPTDSAKSRRVSFSRRTGVAEFVTNEATTTWKNFYEEHNKSLESSGNDSGSKQPVGHLGKRAFDQQFEEVEADFIGTLNSGPITNINSSLNNFEQQLASLECTDDIKLTAPQNKFELSTFTNNHTKMFDDLAISCGEVTDRIDVNFSAVQQIGGNDDLDEIQKDLKQNFGNVPFERQNISEYIEVDLNTTRAKNEDDNMSITDTIQSPKVQDVSKNNSVINVERDWVVDKENIAINPYVAPRETDNFAINEEPDKVLVFDGKRLTIQSENTNKDNYRQSLLPNAPEKAPQRKTIVLNVNDDLPNFLDDPHSSNTSGFVGINELKKTMIIDDMSITEPIQDFKKDRTVLYDDELGNISVTKAIPTNIVPDNGRTILYEENTGNISITQALPTNIAEKQKTIIFDNNNSDISITQALPTNVQSKPNNQQIDKRNTTVFDNCDISMTQAIPANIIAEKSSKRRTIVYENNDGNLSLTQAVPNLIIKESENQRTIVYEDDTGNISVSQAIPSNIIPDNPEKRRTVVFESDSGNISVTQAVPSNLIWQENLNNIDISETEMVPTQTIQENSRRRTIVYEQDTGNLSITQAVSNRVIEEISSQIPTTNDDKETTSKRKTIVFDNEDVDVTEAITSLVFRSQNNISLKIDKMDESLSRVKTHSNATRTVVFENDDVDISMTQAALTNIIKDLNPVDKTEATYKRRTVVFDDDDADISMTQAVNMNQLIPGFSQQIIKQNVHDDLEDALDEALHAKHTAKSFRIVVNDEENTNASISQALQDREENLISQSLRGNVMENALKCRTIVVEEDNVSLKAQVSIMAETDSILDVSMSDIDAKKNDINDIKKSDASIEKPAPEAENTLKESLNSELKSENSIIKPATDSFKDNNETKTKLNTSNYQSQTMESNTKNVNQVLIYQAGFSNRTEHEQSQKQEPIASNEEISTSSHINVSGEHSFTSSKTNAAIEYTDSKESALKSQSIVQRTESTENNDKKSETSSQNSRSIIDDLLDMSSASADGIDDKGMMTNVDEPKKLTNSEIVKVKSCAETISNDTLFYVTRDGEDESASLKDVQQLTDRSPLPLDYNESPKAIQELQSTLGDIKNTLNQERSSEKIASNNLDKSKTKLNLSRVNKSFKTANDTGELLELLSDLTDTTMIPKHEDKEEKDKKPESLLMKGQFAFENKSEIEPRRQSFVPRRQSIVMSREDLLNNISMAGAALKTCLDFDDSELEGEEDTVKDSPQYRSPKKSVRLSNEVVKTLHFDESVSDSTMSDTKLTPLKKTAFGETSYMQDHRPSKVIPDFLKEVSDGIKELMDDLVKPNADVLPFDNGVDRQLKKAPSTCSTQIQANLITSSQVDLNTELYSNSDSAHNDDDKISSSDIINNGMNRSMKRALKSPIKSPMPAYASDKSFDSKASAPEAVVNTYTPRRQTEASPGRVLIFDHNNPLNNVLLAPDIYTEVHRYNPSRSADTIGTSEHSNSAQNDTERVTTQYNVDSVVNSMQQSGDASSGKLPDSQSLMSTLSKPLSLDQSTEAVLLTNVKDTEVNTIIAMKGNMELLDANSSLTLVDDASAKCTIDVSIVPNSECSKEENCKSPVKVIFEVDNDEMHEKLDSDFTSNDEMDERMKPKKRIHSSTKQDNHKYCTMSNLDVTPKPTTKMQKLSESPGGFKTVTYSADNPEATEKNKKKSSRKSKSKMPGTSLTVQQLMTEYNVGPIDHDKLSKQIKDVMRHPKSDTSSVEPTGSQSEVQDVESLDVVSSFTSSNNMRDDRSVTTQSSKHICDDHSLTTQSSRLSKMDWEPEFDDRLSSNSLNECEPSVNVVAKLDMLPFMGSHECEWDSSGGDTWSFRLLHSRVRLLVKLAHRHDNAARTRVRADTPVRSVQLEILPSESKNTLASLCVTFAAETMRYFINRGCVSAGEVPTLLRRCAAAARLAARWGRLMCEARLHLAYCLTADGQLTLKVANISLRCVWEVTMRLELVVEDAREAPWVRAGGVRARRVLAASGTHEPHIARLLRHMPRDWSHAPRTLWKIFKYLKHKTQDDDELFMAN